MNTVAGEMIGDVFSDFLAYRPRKRADRLFIRREIEVKSLSLPAWLRQQRQRPCFYWQDRERRFEIAALGQAHALSSTTGELSGVLQEIAKNLDASDRGVRYVGGTAFDQDNPVVDAPGFGAFRFFVPQVELVRQGERFVLAVNRLADEDPIQKEDLHALLTDRQATLEPTLPTGRCTNLYPDRQAWLRRVSELTGELDERFTKLVLACRADIQLNGDLEPLALVEHLQKNVVGAYNFALQFDETTFLGCSPERLFRREGRRIDTEAIAGTQGPWMQDNGTGKTLLEAAKEGVEHDLVVHDVTRALAKVCDDVQVVATKDVVQWGRLQHLLTRFSAVLRSDKRDGDLLQTLHPSAAVLGYPRSSAWAALRRLESLPRGWYAGPIGWMQRDAAEFAVGIRSAVLQGRDLRLFAGAGIVKESDPAAEWQEVQDKMRPYFEALGVSG